MATIRVTQIALNVFTVSLVPVRATQAVLEVFTVPAPPPVPPFTTRHIRRLRRAPHLSHDHARIAYSRFELDLERGVGLDGVGQGTEPLVELRLSRDGGFTWSEPVRLRAGRLGEYLVRAQASRLGVGRDVVFEVVVSDPVAWSLVGAWLDLAPGTS